MVNIDWHVVTEVAGLGFLVLFIVIGIIALVVWIVSLVISKFSKKPVVTEQSKSAQ
jgi:Na+-transporting methylmalonyl-CoA/oxaloacetate decarboxylase gamma subunit